MLLEAIASALAPALQVGQAGMLEPSASGAALPASSHAQVDPRRSDSLRRSEQRLLVACKVYNPVGSWIEHTEFMR